MKKFDFKTRLQWGWFKSALIGTAIGLLIAPTVGSVLEQNSTQKTESAGKEGNPVLAWFHSISFGSKVKVMINGDVVALAKSEEEGQAAFKTARLQYNADGIRILDVDVTYEPVDKQKDTEVVKELSVLKDTELSDAILESFSVYAESDKELAYTMRINDYTVTVDRMEDLVAILEQAQGRYDVNDSFQVGLLPPASRNVTMYEVGVTRKETAGGSLEDEESTESAEPTGDTGSTGSQGTTDLVQEMHETRKGQAHTIAPTKVALTGETSDEASSVSAKNSDDGSSGEDSDSGESGASGENPEKKADASSENNAEDGADNTSENAADTPAGETSQDGTENASGEEAGDMAGVAQAADDGIKYVGFSEVIQVMETYVGKDQITDKETAYQELTTENQEAAIYVVQPGDYLDLIADQNDLTVDELLEMNPGIKSDEDLYYDDRLNITVPRAAVQILVEKQETYRETYQEDVVYEDDENMFIGETEVVQEGSPGTHIVTDLVTYKDDMEYEREQLEETVEVAAVAEIVKRGTKSQPTYMYPVTVWTITSNFGYRWGRLHAGVDVGVPIGTTVRASRAGQVITAGWVGGYGNCVIIDHGDGISTRYGHLSEVTVSVGQYVDQGQQVALSGNTGRSTGPHLHFEIRINGEAVDPLPYLE